VEDTWLPESYLTGDRTHRERTHGERTHGERIHAGDKASVDLEEILVVPSAAGQEKVANQASAVAESPASPAGPRRVATPAREATPARDCGRTDLTLTVATRATESASLHTNSCE
jgi:hypothetical protein